MVYTPSTAVGISTAVFALGKAAWELGGSLSRLRFDTQIVDSTVTSLSSEVRSLGNVCELVCSELQQVVNKSETGTSPPYDVDEKIWNSLTSQIEDISRTMQELEMFVKNFVTHSSGPAIQEQQQQQQPPQKLERTKQQISGFRLEISKHAENLQVTLLLIRISLTYLSPRRADRGLPKELERGQDMVDRLQKSWEDSPHTHFSQTQALLIQCAREVLVKGTNLYEASLSAESVEGGHQEGVNTSVATCKIIPPGSTRQDQRASVSASSFPLSYFAPPQAVRSPVTPASPFQQVSQRPTSDYTVDNESDNDFDLDLAKAALDTGTQAFETREWHEATSLLQEASELLLQLPKHQRAFCDTFSLQYKLAVCAYYTADPADAEAALISLEQQAVSSDQQRICVFNATHLLSLLYVRTGRIDQARSECEKALHARRRLLGKQSEEALESTALMAHIYTLLDYRARAKSCLTMIPETRRGAILRSIEESLSTQVETIDTLSLRSRSMSEDSNTAMQAISSRLSTSSIAVPTDQHGLRSMSTSVSQTPTVRSPIIKSPVARSPATSVGQSPQVLPSSKAEVSDRQSVTVTLLSSADDKSESTVPKEKGISEHYSTCPEVIGTGPPIPSEMLDEREPYLGQTLSRGEILEKVGCQPKDRIEDAVCESNYHAFDALLSKKKEFWRSKLRKSVRSERVTALHFAALFGEIEMARRLISSGYNINEVPFGYSTSLAPLTFAVGARQVEMVDFLAANGAKPCEPETWSTLAGQLLNRAWLMKTVSDIERTQIPNRIVAIIDILLRYGLHLNAPFDASGRTLLHQAVTFMMGSYRWDANLRSVVTSFLCERGADPFQVNREGRSAYDLALASGHQDLLIVMERASKLRRMRDMPLEPIELPGELPTTIRGVG